jgi:hypothetical protein
MPRYWLCFDVGLTSSFESLYAWLDDRKAVECGDNVATFVYNKDFDSVVKELLTTIRKNGGRTRLYLIGKRSPHGTVGGKFIAGRRKTSPWEGFGTSPSSAEEDEG